jgi:hypothetical protein
MVVFYWHTPIIPYYVEAIFFDSPRGKIPVTWITDVRFLYLLVVNKKFSITKFNVFALPSDHTF